MIRLLFFIMVGIFAFASYLFLKKGKLVDTIVTNLKDDGTTDTLLSAEKKIQKQKQKQIDKVKNKIEKEQSDLNKLNPTIDEPVQEAQADVDTQTTEKE